MEVEKLKQANAIVSNIEAHTKIANTIENEIGILDLKPVIQLNFYVDSSNRSVIFRRYSFYMHLKTELAYNLAEIEKLKRELKNL